MNDSLVQALESMFTLQRWNSLPRVETWAEAENAAYVTHVAYAIGRASGLPAVALTCAMQRSLLKSLNKHFMTDIALPVRETLKAKNSVAWTALVDGFAKKSSGLFSRRISADMHLYLTDKPGYTVGGEQNEQAVQRIEALVKFAQLHAASEECRANAVTYTSDFAAILASLTTEMGGIPEAAGWTTLVDHHSSYFRSIRRLKYLRRWNRVNRTVPSTVLGHTYVVTLLSLMLASLSSEEHKGNGLFLYNVLLRALFHDIPESLTGDIVTPVKQAISDEDSTLMKAVETELTGALLAGAPTPVREDVSQYDLLSELDNRTIYVASSLVKDCDRLALLLECINERAAGISVPEMVTAYYGYQRELSRSEWTAVRDFATDLAEHWSVLP